MGFPGGREFLEFREKKKVRYFFGINLYFRGIPRNPMEFHVQNSGNNTTRKDPRRSCGTPWKLIMNMNMYMIVNFLEYKYY
jgi:hypothetical protein